MGGLYLFSFDRRDGGVHVTYDDGDGVTDLPEKWFTGDTLPFIRFILDIKEHSPEGSVFAYDFPHEFDFDTMDLLGDARLEGKYILEVFFAHPDRAITVKHWLRVQQFPLTDTLFFLSPLHIDHARLNGYNESGFFHRIAATAFLVPGPAPLLGLPEKVFKATQLQERIVYLSVFDLLIGLNPELRGSDIYRRKRRKIVDSFHQPDGRHSVLLFVDVGENPRGTVRRLNGSEGGLKYSLFWAEGAVQGAYRCIVYNDPRDVCYLAGGIPDRVFSNLLHVFDRIRVDMYNVVESRQNIVLDMVVRCWVEDLCGFADREHPSTRLLEAFFRTFVTILSYLHAKNRLVEDIDLETFISDFASRSPYDVSDVLDEERTEEDRLVDEVFNDTGWGGDSSFMRMEEDPYSVSEIPKVDTTVVEEVIASVEIEQDLPEEMKEDDPGFIPRRMVEGAFEDDTDLISDAEGYEEGADVSDIAEDMMDEAFGEAEESVGVPGDGGTPRTMAAALGARFGRRVAGADDGDGLLDRAGVAGADDGDGLLDRAGVAEADDIDGVLGKYGPTDEVGPTDRDVTVDELPEDLVDDVWGNAEEELEFHASTDEDLGDGFVEGILGGSEEDVRGQSGTAGGVGPRGGGGKRKAVPASQALPKLAGPSDMDLERERKRLATEALRVAKADLAAEMRTEKQMKRLEAKREKAAKARLKRFVRISRMETVVLDRVDRELGLDEELEMEEVVVPTEEEVLREVVRVDEGDPGEDRTYFFKELPHVSYDEVLIDLLDREDLSDLRIGNIVQALEVFGGHMAESISMDLDQEIPFLISVLMNETFDVIPILKDAIQYSLGKNFAVKWIQRLVERADSRWSLGFLLEILASLQADEVIETNVGWKLNEWTETLTMRRYGDEMRIVD